MTIILVVQVFLKKFNYYSSLFFKCDCLNHIQTPSDTHINPSPNPFVDPINPSPTPTLKK